VDPCFFCLSASAAFALPFSFLRQIFFASSAFFSALLAAASANAACVL
jgi:hypothetical protein